MPVIKKTALNPNIKLYTLTVIALLASSGCSNQQEVTADPADQMSELNQVNTAPPNVLIIIADDLGVEQLESFGIGSEPAVTPNLNQLASAGMSFLNVWSQPTCSPTRATLLTGRYGFQTGVGRPPTGVNGDYPRLERSNGTLTLSEFEDLNFSQKPVEVYENLTPVIENFSRLYISEGDDTNLLSKGLSSSELTLPEIFRRSGNAYTTGVIGKWHLGDTENGWLQHPANAGFDYYSVNMMNQPESYFAWYENLNGVLEQRTGYTPEEKINTAVDWIGQQSDSPWFLWLALNLPHYPHHVPDVEGLETSAIQADDPRAALDIMTARMDQEIGRLLAGIGEDELDETIIVFIGDNGTTGEANDPPFHPDRGKFTLYEGGLRVPLIISGPGVPEGEMSDALVNSTDLFATITELAGIEVTGQLDLNSVSLVPYFSNPTSGSIRNFIFSDAFYSSRGVEEGAFAIRNDTHKLIRWHDHQELYNLVDDAYENNNLLLDGFSEVESAMIEELESLVDTLRNQDKN